MLDATCDMAAAKAFFCSGKATMGFRPGSGDDRWPRLPSQGDPKPAIADAYPIAGAARHRSCGSSRHGYRGGQPSAATTQRSRWLGQMVAKAGLSALARPNTAMWSFLADLGFVDPGDELVGEKFRRRELTLRPIAKGLQ
jgi:hypothetical protein